MFIQAIELGGDVRVALTGRMDDQQLTCLDQAIDGIEIRSRMAVIFDLADAESLGSAALGRMVSLHQRLTREGGRVRLVNVPTPILIMLTAMKLNQLCEVGPRC